MEQVLFKFNGSINSAAPLKEEADAACVDSSCWVEFLSPEEAKKITY